MDFCAKKGFAAKKAQGPLARLHQLGALHSDRTGRARTTAGAVILARAAALRADPCAGAPAGEGCNPCQERAPFPGGKAPCRNDARCFNPEPEGKSKGKKGLAQLAAAAWEAAEGVVATATGAKKEGKGECRPALCASGDHACYTTALAVPKAGGYPAVDSGEFQCALYDDALFRPAEGVPPPTIKPSPSSSLVSSLLHSHVNLEWCDKIKLSDLLLPP